MAVVSDIYKTVLNVSSEDGMRTYSHLKQSATPDNILSFVNAIDAVKTSPHTKVYRTTYSYLSEV